MKTKLSHSIFQFALIISLLLSIALGGCAGAVNFGAAGAPQIVSLGAWETVRGIKSVVSGASGTFALIDASGQVLILAWPKGTAYAFSMMDVDGKWLTGNAMKVATMSLATSVKGLEAQGWKMLTSSQIPAKVAQAIAGYTIQAVLLGAKALPTIFLVPIYLLPGNKDTRTAAPVWVS